ncbi:MAG: hypothetical protein K2Y05_07635, partial [Hyphomicrobiaceae bacterium]|nr:hypothetical protein [Hyphomicrobiaceae bacterium]
MSDEKKPISPEAADAPTPAADSNDHNTAADAAGDIPNVQMRAIIEVLQADLDATRAALDAKE